jgi:hypothetical protein
VTEDGRFAALARFGPAEARRNGDRPEHGQRWD